MAVSEWYAVAASQRLKSNGGQTSPKRDGDSILCCCFAVSRTDIPIKNIFYKTPRKKFFEW